MKKVGRGVKKGGVSNGLYGSLCGSWDDRYCGGYVCLFSYLSF